MSAALVLFLAAAADWQSLFNGTSLERWKETPFPRHPAVRVEKEAIILPAGQPLTGVTWTAAFPHNNYEIRFEAQKGKGGDFFASLTFPVDDSHLTWVLGGWGGDIVGLSCIDGWDASDNETRSYFTFEQSRWYSMRLRVTPEKILAWIDDRQVINVGIAGRELTLRPGDIEMSAPLGFASYNTTGVIRKIEFRQLN